MKKQVEMCLEHVSGNHSTSNGLVIQVTRPHDPTIASSYCSGRIIFPSRWHTTTTVTFNDNRLHFIVIGHLYARESDSFDVLKSLHLLGQVYRKKGIDAVRNEIGGGMFALFVVDYENQQLHAMCDLLACMPLFFLEKSNLVTLATNQLDFKDQQRLLRKACLEYIRYGYLPYSPSLFEGVQRLGPGQVITVDLLAGKIMRLTEEFPVYPTLSERIDNKSEACRELDRVFDRFYSRLGNEPIALGLSGGYDSRLIAAFTKKQKPYLVTFNYPGTVEGETARRVAQLLGNNTHLFDIPSDAPSQCVNDFYLGMQTLDNLESSHVFALLDALMRGEPSYIIDGYLGGATVGGSYYYQLSGGAEPAFKVLSLQDKYDQKIRSIESYTSYCYTGLGRTVDLSHILGKKEDDFISRDKLGALISKQLECCFTHADMIELLKYRFRGRCMIACGPITFLRRVHTLCPYYDTDVMTTCMSIDKKLRAGDRVFNAFWRYRFPELAKMPKENTGGFASQTDLVYRLTHLQNALVRRIVKRLPRVMISKYKPGGNIGDFEKRYLSNPANRKFFEQTLARTRSILCDSELGAILSAINKPGSSNQLYLRVVSLATLLADNKS